MTWIYLNEIKSKYLFLYQVESSSSISLLAKNLERQRSHWIDICSISSAILSKFLLLFTSSKSSRCLSFTSLSSLYCMSSPIDATKSFLSSAFTCVCICSCSFRPFIWLSKYSILDSYKLRCVFQILTELSVEQLAKYNRFVANKLIE